MFVFNYQPETGEYLGPSPADESPLEPGVILVPAYATTIVPPAHQEGFIRRFVNGEWGYAPIEEPDVEPTPDPVVTELMVIAERQMRLSSGFAYDFGDERGQHLIGTTPADMYGWDEVTKLAQAAINSGMPDHAIHITTNTGAVSVTAMEWQSVLLAAGAHRQPIFAASFNLQAMAQIPRDYADDSYWP
ncbi:MULTISPECIES: hypothetical protein [Rhizobium]|uniref:hypothetical protein n=1 Tax=Rhizobium TaxID=379 RepID=UPI0019331532|nr:hypothetical protein [Rhizobium rosettiformans]